MPSSRPSITGNVVFCPATPERVPPISTWDIHDSFTLAAGIVSAQPAPQAGRRYAHISPTVSLGSACSPAATIKASKEEVPTMKKFDVLADVATCPECSSSNIVGTSDPNVHRECLNCGALMLTDGDVLKMVV